MFKFRRFKALFIKESYQIIRDPSAILIAFILPLILLFLMGYAISLDSKHTPIGIVVEKSSKYTLSLVDAFRMSESFKVEVGNNRMDFEEKLQRGTIRAIIVIPSTFEKDLETSNTKIQILADGSEPNIAGFVQKYSSGVWSNWLEQEGFSKKSKISSLNIQTRYWFNSPLLSSYFLLPGSIAIILTLIGTLLTALVVAREWERGTMEAIMSTPITIMELLLGKLLPYFVLAMISMLICVSIAIFWFEIPFRGSVLLLFLTSALYLFPALGLGLLISTLAKNQFVAAQAALIVGFLPAFLLSGFIFQISSMPTWLQYITHAIPARYLIEILQCIFLSGDIYEVILPNVFAMIIVGTIIFSIIIKITRKRLD
ncbi:ABC transporter permease [Arcobacter sp. s6]|uniref:ABC transporter permease n=1 Tax=Arcobacter sp. s6 TaxID=3230363 RepID=UPI0034A07CDE